jgi:hypothetical protein
VSEEDLAMSVVIMELVEAERAGVVFTVDPAGSSNDLRIEAVEGLGEQLVSGEVTPEAYVLPRSSAHRPGIDPVLDEAVEAALDLELRFGAPQDVEWAHDGRKLYIVQTRPITTVSLRDDGDGFDAKIGEDHAFTTAGIAESLPGVLPPLQWTTAAPLLEAGFRQLFDQMNALPPVADDRPFIARVHGRAVLSLDLMRAAAAEVPGGSAEEIERQYFGRVTSEPDESQQDTGPGGPFKGLRSMFTGFREINARRSFRFEALTSIDTTERLLLSPPNCTVALRLLRISRALLRRDVRGARRAPACRFGRKTPGWPGTIAASGSRSRTRPWGIRSPRGDVSDADIPVLQVSMPTLDPAELFDIGRLLAPLRDEGVLILGSGFSTHNLTEMNMAAPATSAPPTWSSEFDDWLDRTFAAGDMDELMDFQAKAPAASLAHPRTEHFAPLFVALGAAADDSLEVETAIDGFWYGLSKRSVQLT